MRSLTPVACPSPRADRLALLALAAVLGACTGSQAPPPEIPLEDRQIAVLDVGHGPDWLVAGFGSIWARRGYGDVLRIDPSSHEVTATIATAAPFELCQGTGVDTDSIWTCSGSTIVRIDPITNEVVDVVEAGKIFGQGRLVHEAGRIWILTGQNGDELVGVDVATLRIGAPIALEVACSDLAVGNGAVWAACPASNLVLVVDPVAGTVTDRIEVATPTQISVGPTATWVGSADGIVRIDLKDRSTRVAVEDLVLGDIGSVWASATAIWARAAMPFLTRIDPATSRVVETITSQEYGTGGDVLGLDGTLWALDSDEGVIVHLRAEAP